MRDWNGKRYWLVGASEGLGLAVAQRLSRMGVEVILSARSEDRLKELAAEMPGQAQAVVVDVSDPKAVEMAWNEIGEIDGFVYLAGYYEPMKAQDWQGEQVERMIDINLTGAMRCLAHVAPDFAKRGTGHIVLTGSLSAYRGLPGAIGYSASKAAMASLAESIYIDLFRSGVEVQVIHPGYIRTRLTDKNDFSMPQIMEPEKAAEYFVDHMASGTFEKAYPAPFAWFFRLCTIMPNWLYLRIFR
ncbi:MAG: SDR family NAD(P)-dependent oxidoreductase [Pseudomonadota bacterium]